MRNFVKIWQIGNINYCRALQVQKYLANLHTENAKSGNIVLFLEHPPVYTTGIRTKCYSKHEEKKLQNEGAEFYRTNRGGLITFHGPGQLVVYPILNLKMFKPSMRWYVGNLENTVILLCKKFGLNAETSPHTGVWIGDDKVCAIGIHGSRFITTHGLALNCCTDLNWFKHIIPCGIKNKGVTSLTQELNRHVSVEEVIPVFLDCFSQVFNCNYVNIPKKEVDVILSYIK